MYKINTPEFKKLKKSQYGRGTDFKQNFVEFVGNNCFIPTSGICFIKCIKNFTDEEYTEKVLNFFRTEQRRPIVMTFSRIQPFCEKYNINIGCFDGFRVCPRSFTEKNIAIKTHNNHFCLVSKSNGFSYNKVIEKESKPNFKVVDSIISDKHVKSLLIMIIN